MKTIRQHKLWWQSSYDRGLDMLLFIWPDIKKAYPKATLDVAYGFELFDIAYANNPERQQWKESIKTLLNQDGITHLGRIGQKELKEKRKECGILAYPTYFTEIFMIGAVEAQSDGLVPVVMNLAALKETVGSGIKVDGDIKDLKIQKEYLEKLLNLMGDTKLWEEESKKAVKFAEDYTWDKISDKWIEVFKEKNKEVKVSICTPTIRTGWWNIMAENISRQSYKNLEWIIVDDYKEDRTEIARKYATKYNLKITYLRGGSGSSARKCNLVHSNNLGWKEAKGELLVWLQDFILMPENGIEKLVNLHRLNPDAILAPCDVYYHAKKANKKNLEDWWDGDLDIMTEKGWTNPRVQNLGIRSSDNPYHYEANYGAIPKKILNELNGWYELLDDGLGFDNYDIAFRALESGYKIIVDDTNICKCINIWTEVTGTAENVLNRERMANPPRAMWLVKQIKMGNVPIIRDEKIDNSISLQYDIPEMDEKLISKWIDKHTDEIVEKWGDYKK